MNGRDLALGLAAGLAVAGLARHRGSLAVESVQPGDTVRFLLGWDKKKHPVVTGTVLHPYAMGERGDWIVRYVAADGKPNEVAVATRSMHPGPAPASVVQFRPRGSADRERAVLVPVARSDWSGREIGTVPDAWFAFSHLTGDIRVSRGVSRVNGDVHASWKVFARSTINPYADLVGLLTGNDIAARDTLPYCQKALDALRAQTGASIRGLFHVGSLEMNKAYRGRGIARALYRDMVTVAAEHGLAVAPGACYRDADHPHLGRGSTTPAAQRIWEDLAREYPHARARTRLVLWGGPVAARDGSRSRDGLPDLVTEVDPDWANPKEALPVEIMVYERGDTGTKAQAFTGRAEGIRRLLRDQAIQATDPDGGDDDVDTLESLARVVDSRERVGFVDTVEVWPPSKKGQGVGRLLWETLKAALVAQGIDDVYLLATGESRSFWRHVGFQSEDRHWRAGALILMSIRLRGST